MPFIARIWFGVFAALVAFQAAPPAFAAARGRMGEASCAPYPNVPVEVNPVFDKPALNFASGLAEMQGISKGGAKVIPHGDEVALGVTSYSLITEFAIPVITQQMEDGSFCASVDKVNANIGYREVTVHVAKEFPQGSCAFRHIYEHELKHIAVNRQVLEEYSVKMREKISAYMKLYGVRRVADPKYAEKLLKDDVAKILNEMSSSMSEENRRRQRLIDTPEEYAKNSTACGGAISREMERYVRAKQRR